MDRYPANFAANSHDSKLPQTSANFHGLTWNAAKSNHRMGLCRNGDTQTFKEAKKDHQTLHYVSAGLSSDIIIEWNTWTTYFLRATLSSVCVYIHT